MSGTASQATDSLKRVWLTHPGDYSDCTCSFNMQDVACHHILSYPASIAVDRQTVMLY